MEVFSFKSCFDSLLLRFEINWFYIFLASLLALITAAVMASAGDEGRVKQEAIFGGI